MPHHDVIVTLSQILEECESVAEFVAGRNRDELSKDKMLRHSIVRSLEIIGEAARRLPEPTKQKMPDVPWHAVVAMRNRLIHAYDFVDVDTVWRVATSQLPQLADVVRRALREGLL